MGRASDVHVHDILPGVVSFEPSLYVGDKRPSQWVELGGRVVPQNHFWEGTMKLPRRRQFLHLAAGTAMLPAVSSFAWAQAYPTRPITMIVPAGPGSAFDTSARIVADRMRGSLKQPIIVENVPGADGNLGTGRAARARPDGYTIITGSVSTHVLSAALYSLPYDVLNDFAPISPVVMSPYVLLAKRTMQAKDLHELIAWLKANPNKALVGFSIANNHVLSAYFQKETATQFTLVPYRSGGAIIQDLVAGQNRSLFRHSDSIAAGPGREHKSLRGDERQTLGDCTRHSDLQWRPRRPSP